MQFLKSLLLVVLLFSFATSSVAQTFADHRAVVAEAEIDEDNTTITLQWKGSSDATQFSIFRRDLGANSWTRLNDMAGGTGDFSYADNNIIEGKAYEYAIEKTSSINEPFASGGVKLRGYAYLASGINVEPNHSKGTAWVLASKLVADSLDNEITLLLQDLSADGYTSELEVITETATVEDVKTFIDEKAAEGKCDVVYLLGHVPVPYSGTFCTDPQYQSPPDGHTNNHCGAWPADVYYGVIDGSWVDNATNTSASREENQNRPGDGKFDNNRIPGTATIAVGRVDMSDLPAFSHSEVELTRNYLNKVRSFKLSQSSTNGKAIIENNFAGFQEGFSSAAIRDFSAYMGSANVATADLFTATADDDYLFSYVCGAGSYTSCAGVGNTNDFTTKNGAMFNHMFGSYFGDFDVQNNILRATIATEKMGLTAVWSGRPKWITHSLAIGESFGDCALKTQNNWQDYDANFFQNSPHIALVGDPSLRTHYIAPASNITATPSTDKTSCSVSWDASLESDILGYYVYRSHKPNGSFKLVNTQPTTSTTLTDNAPFQGTNYYMVRAAKKTTTSSGSYINLSLGISTKAEGLIGGTSSIHLASIKNLTVYPTLTHSTLYVERASAELLEINILDQMGRSVKKATSNSQLTTIDVSTLSSGVYYISVPGKTTKFIKQ
jgi:hypothetical protein